VRASQTRGVTSNSSGQETFDLWRVPGRKRLALGVSGLTLAAEISERRLRWALADDLADGATYACTIPLGPDLLGRLETFHAKARALEGHAPTSPPSRPATRAMMVHLRALQALDAAQDGASHRDIAQTLFGLEEVVLRWHEDGELRAQVRHLLRRGQAYMDGDYLTLAGFRRTEAKRPGDEVPH